MNENTRMMLSICAGALGVGVLAFFGVALIMPAEAPPEPFHEYAPAPESGTATLDDFNDFEGVGDGLNSSAASIASEGVNSRYDKESGKVVTEDDPIEGTYRADLYDENGNRRTVRGVVEREDR